jgi:hypothetical protein
MQTRVPAELLGRVSALEWMASSALVPLSYNRRTTAGSVHATPVIARATGEFEI